ncbi:MAG: Verru_Chthon cassette protein B [Verrucomicrobiota bacterium]|nr:Verru_Chthon cassette protein B [Verrucomicrobiota bacterium]
MIHHGAPENERLGPRPNARPKETASLHINSAAFTLVEIVLALGIVAFAVVALVGLMTASLDSSRGSEADTLIASMARQITAELQTRPFDSLTTEGPEIYYFDNEAHQLPDKQGAIYLCKVTLTLRSDYDTEPVDGAAAQPNLYEVQLDFASALAANPARMQSVHTAIARHE